MYAFLRNFQRDEGGAIAAIIALSLFVLLGFAAAAIDMSYANATRTELQVAASAAALAGVQQIVDENGDGVDDTGQYRRGAVEFIYRNMAAAQHGSIVDTQCGTYNPSTGAVLGGGECLDIKVGHWAPTTRSFTAWDAETWDAGAMALDAVMVRAHRAGDHGNPLNLFLAPAVGLAEQEIRVSAIAWAEGTDNLNNCMIALDPEAEKSMHVEGTANLTSDGCGICINSTDPAGLWLNGNPDVYVDAGSITVNSPDYHIEGVASIFPTPTLNGGSCSDPFVDATPFDSHFENAVCPDDAQPTVYEGRDFHGDGVRVAPGLHCGGISFKGTGHVEFLPGVHHIKDGTLLEEGKHTYFGEGVTFLIDNATINLGGSQSNDLSAGAGDSPFLFYENPDPDAPRPSEDHIFRGDASANLQGAIYTPLRDVEFVGTSSGASIPPECLVVIANTFHFTGTTDMELTTDGCGGLALEQSAVTFRLVD